MCRFKKPMIIRKQAKKTAEKTIEKPVGYRAIEHQRNLGIHDISLTFFRVVTFLYPSLYGPLHHIITTAIMIISSKDPL